MVVSASTRRRKFLAAGLPALAASPIPSLLQFHLGDGGEFWAGLPLLAVGALLLVRAFWPERPESDGPLAAVTFRELSAIIVIVALVLGYGFFLLDLVTGRTAVADALPSLVGRCIFMAVVVIGGHILLGVFRLPDREDERDREIDARSARIGYAVLSAGTCAVLVLALVLTPPPLIVCATMGALVLAEIVRLTCQVVYYRTGR